MGELSTSGIDLTGIPRLSEFKNDASLAEASFRLEHGDAFLVLTHSGPETLDVPTKPQSTAVVENSPDLQSLPPNEYLVFPVKKSGRSLIQRFVGVGRTRKNDVVIPDRSLSKFHAYFQRGSQGWLLQDARSNNGTFVDDLKVPPQGQGAPVRLKSGSRIRFGSVELIFLEAPRFQTFVRRMFPK